MGTRHLIQVNYKGQTRIAQYGQWDGYPSGQGKTVLNFLKTRNLEVFKKKLENVFWMTQEEVDKTYSNLNIEADGGGLILSSDADRHGKLYPELCRDTGANILDLVLDNDKTGLVNSEDFKEDTLFCEWYYLIDLDKNTLEVGNGASKTYQLDNLPEYEQFLKDLEEKE